MCDTIAILGVWDHNAHWYTSRRVQIPRQQGLRAQKLHLLGHDSSTRRYLDWSLRHASMLCIFSSTYTHRHVYMYLDINTH